MVRPSLVATLRRNGFFASLCALLWGLAKTLAHWVGSLQGRRYEHPMTTRLPISLRHSVTQRYPHESLPVPSHGRYKLHNEIDDCIVCDKCARACPVDCIDIVAVRAEKDIGRTSDGKPKRLYAERFDIDMSKCCFCGLCTVVCPTECLTMTADYDFSTEHIADHLFSFADASKGNKKNSA